MQTAPSPNRNRDGQAGFIAALLMLTVQLLWRLGGERAVPSLAEIIVAAISRLTPMEVFDAATGTLGSNAKKLLFVAVIAGIIGLGYWAGIVAGRIVARAGRSRLEAGLLVATALFLVVTLLVMPLAGLGAFGRDAAEGTRTLVVLAVTFAAWALAWSRLSRPEPATVAQPGSISRRSLGSEGVRGVLALAGLLGVTYGAWRILFPKAPSTDISASEQRADDIVATQRAGQRTPTPEASTEPIEVAALQSDQPATPAIDDPLAYFADLDAQGILTPLVTPVPAFYSVSKNLVDPDVSADGWTLTITGMVARELVLTLDDLKARATTKKITTLCCISNELNGDLISTAEWLGVPLADLLQEAGVMDGAIDLKFHAADDYEDSTTIEWGMDPDNLVVVGMNGEDLPKKNGFPARLIIPNIYGMKNVKWIDRIEVVDHDFIGYWEGQGWSDTAICQIWGRFDHPLGSDTLPAGPAVVTGIAMAGDRDIARVEVSLDGGETWADAVLEPSLNPPFTWVRWAFPFEATDGKVSAVMRVTDGTGTLMTEEENPPLPDGSTGWPRRKFKVQG